MMILKIRWKIAGAPSSEQAHCALRQLWVWLLIPINVFETIIIKIKVRVKLYFANFVHVPIWPNYEKDYLTPPIPFPLPTLWVWTCRLSTPHMDHFAIVANLYKILMALCSSLSLPLCLTSSDDMASVSLAKSFCQHHHFPLDCDDSQSNMGSSLKQPNG